MQYVFTKSASTYNGKHSFDFFKGMLEPTEGVEDIIISTWKKDGTLVPIGSYNDSSKKVMDVVQANSIENSNDFVAPNVSQLDENSMRAYNIENAPSVSFPNNIPETAEIDTTEKQASVTTSVVEEGKSVQESVKSRGRPGRR